MMNKPKTIAVTLVMILLTAFSVSAQSRPTQLLGSWKLMRSDALDRIRNSEQYLTMPEKHREAFDAQADLIMKVTEYEFKPNNELVYMDVEHQTLVDTFIPVKRSATWTLKDGIITIKETNRPFERQMKIVTLDEKLLVVNLILDGKVTNGEVAFSFVK